MRGFWITLAGRLSALSSDTSQSPRGVIPERASPDYNGFTYGQMIGDVDVWFIVDYNGDTGYYASYYDDSSCSSAAT